MYAWRRARRTRKRYSPSRPTLPVRGTTRIWPGRYYGVSTKRSGLPLTVKMRHDAHYVEEIISRSGAAIGRMIPVEQIQPNAEQPRRDLGDLSDLTQSVREKGVL